MGKIVVLGATGTLGLPICRYLKDKGYDVFAVGHSLKGKELFERLGITFSTIEIEKAEQFDNLPNSNVDCVLNFAGALPAMMKESSSNAMYSDTIVRGTINVIDYMLRVGCKKLIFPQSVYDLHYLFGTPEPLSPDAERVNPLEGDHSVYVICKNAAIDIIKYYENTYGIQGIVLRLPGVYQYHPKPFILINGKKRIKLERVWIEKAKKGETLEIWGDSQRILESVCIEDFLQIIEKSIESKTAKGIYNVGNGCKTTLERKVLDIRDVFSKKENLSNVVYLPNKPNCTQYVLDIEKTKRDLGYCPQYDWKKYLINLKWHMENEPNKDIWGSFEDYYQLLDVKTDEDRYEK